MRYFATHLGTNKKHYITKPNTSLQDTAVMWLQPIQIAGDCLAVQLITDHIHSTTYGILTLSRLMCDVCLSFVAGSWWWGVCLGCNGASCVGEVMSATGNGFFLPQLLQLLHSIQTTSHSIIIYFQLYILIFISTDSPTGYVKFILANVYEHQNLLTYTPVTPPHHQLTFPLGHPLQNSSLLRNTIHQHLYFHHYHSKNNHY